MCGHHRPISSRKLWTAAINPRLIVCSHVPSPPMLLCRAISSREFWTTNPALMQQLAQGSEECLARNDTRCPRASPPFHYSVRITGGCGLWDMWC